MARVKRGVTTHARHKKVLELAKGYRGRGSTAYRIAIEKVEKALRYAYRDRRNKKRDFRALWIQRINAGAREHGLTYSQFMHGVKLAGLDLTARCCPTSRSASPRHLPRLSRPCKQRWRQRLRRRRQPECRRQKSRSEQQLRLPGAGRDPPRPGMPVCADAGIAGVGGDLPTGHFARPHRNWLRREGPHCSAPFHLRAWEVGNG